MDKKLRKKLHNTLIMVNYVPKHKILYILIIIMKAIPLFIITHDWNIHYKHGITYYLSLITTLPIIHKLNSQNIALFFILFLYSNSFNFILYFNLCICKSN